MSGYISTNTAASLSSLTVSNTIAFSLGGGSKHNLLAQTGIQVTLATLDQGTQTFNVPITAQQKLSFYYSNLGFLSNVTGDIQSQLDKCITSIPTSFTTLTLNNASVAT